VFSRAEPEKVNTRTDPHGHNQNTVDSEYSAEVTARPTDTGDGDSGADTGGGSGGRGGGTFVRGNKGTFVQKLHSSLDIVFSIRPVSC
jgi:hypothetical protein